VSLKPDSPSEVHDDDSLYLGRSLAQTRIAIRGARTHNLKNIDLDIPRNQLVVITGLSARASPAWRSTPCTPRASAAMWRASRPMRQFLGRLDKPDVDLIEGLSPAISIEQATSHNPRSTVGTVTEINDYLRLLYARAGTPFCPDHNLPLQAQTISQMVDSVLQLPEDTKLMILAPWRARKGRVRRAFRAAAGPGLCALSRRRADLRRPVPAQAGEERAPQHRCGDRPRQGARRHQAAPGRELRGRLARRRCRCRRPRHRAGDGRWQEHLFSAKFACPLCDYSLPELEPRLFSFNSPMGACQACDGLGNSEAFDPDRVVPFPSLSLASGAIKGWDKRNNFSMLESVAKHYGVSTETAFEELPEKVRDVILFGSGDESMEFNYVFESGERKGEAFIKSHPFEGIIPNIQRRFRETESQVVRDDLAKLRSVRKCPECEGTRLRREARFVRVGDGEQARSIYEVSHATLADALGWFKQLSMAGAKAEIADKIVREIASRLLFLNDVGLSYLSLDRSADTLSGGEAQRIRLASQIGSGLTGVMYVLDEPSIGLHQRDNDKLIATLEHLRDIGNSVIVVEHDEDMMRAADQIIDMGPGAGVHGGRIMAQGSYEDIKASPDSPTGRYLSGVQSIPVPRQRTAWLPVLRKESEAEASPEHIALSRHCRQEAGIREQGAHRPSGADRARGHNLRNVTVDFPVGLFTCVTGVSGSGKSTLVNDTLYAEAARQIHRAGTEPAAHDDIAGIDYFDKVINVDQSPIGRTPRSNPATYTGLFTPIRELMAETNTAKERGYGPGRSRSTSRAAAAKPARATAWSRWKCIFCPMSTCPATSATASATTARRWKCSGRAGTSRRFWR
jgi:excinuclease ABC subunit A